VVEQEGTPLKGLPPRQRPTNPEWTGWVDAQETPILSPKDTRYPRWDEFLRSEMTSLPDQAVLEGAVGEFRAFVTSGGES